ncbi:glycosyltransferase family 1 protein [Paenibacillus cremeus]|uniref:Glycosyltransferase family 1 protein n=2 Tax=Paenibacillus cremeus TaxID=2163881 RepID=A0A559KBL0_9BACL|nr:glycosyltransferase family 1 protein [Paenibacillus cremeus]
MTTAIPSSLARLPELAYNLWYSWNPSAQALFSRIHPQLWEQLQHNPVRLLQEVTSEALEAFAKDTAFLRQYEQVLQQWDAYREAGTWFGDTYPQHTQQAIAYFCAEFGFHESLPIYSGGLGILAGDHCKSASDLGIPFIGIGLLYKKGYFKQRIDAEGGQQAEYVTYDFTKLPILPVYAPRTKAANEEAEQLTVALQVSDRTVKLKVWAAEVGRIRVYLLDADVEGNSPWDRELTAQLYGGTQDTRIAQEIVLGIGGIKALRALDIPVGAYHINEGHAAFLTFERLREQLDQGLPFHVALELVRASTVFTTHTPVPAGHDAFPMPMYEYYFRGFFPGYEAQRDTFTQLGYDPDKNLFNMTHLALNTSAIRGGVSKLHGQVSRDMFRKFHGNIDANEVPIGHITNGIHLSTWLAPELKELYGRFLPGHWQSQQADPEQWSAIEHLPAEWLWSAHRQLKEKLIRHARENLAEQCRRTGQSAGRIEEAQRSLSPDALTIGFARRFATYKRANLIFSDLSRLDRLVNHPERPIQFLFAGKAHPADHPGQELIREIHRVSQLAPFRGKVVVLENYDTSLARYLVQGVDVWLNNPRRPYEASGTSGQKAAMNGVINFSVLDGWWEEGYDGTNGWSIYANNEADWETQERENKESIYQLLEHEIAPLYYQESPVPTPWVSRMKRSIQTLAPKYNTDRMVMDYTNDTYLPSLRRTEHLSADAFAEATKVADYKRFIQQHWHKVRIIEVNDGTSARQPALPVDRLKDVTATVKFGPVWFKDTAVELLYYEEHPDAWRQVIVTMEPARQLDDSSVIYHAMIPAHLKHGPHFSVRVLPISENFARRFELPLVTTF